MELTEDELETSCITNRSLTRSIRAVCLCNSSLRISPILFYDKVVKIKDSISEEAIETLSNSPSDCPALSDFRPDTEKEIMRSISDSSLASCELHPWHTMFYANNESLTTKWYRSSGYEACIIRPGKRSAK